MGDDHRYVYVVAQCTVETIDLMTVRLSHLTYECLDFESRRIINEIYIVCA
jgi:GMP synthase PP-ATPase subunit